MASRTISNTGGNWNDLAAWVENIVPINGDDVKATATSGNLIVNVSSACKSIDFTNYTNIVTWNNTLTVSGNVTLVSTMTITTTSGTPLLSIITASTLTSNTKVFPYRIAFSFTGTFTLADNWTVGHLSCGATTCTINGNTLTNNGDLTLTATTITGTTNIILAGTGTWTGTSSSLKNNLTINTAGTITVSGIVNYNTGTLTYTAGTVVTTGSTLTIGASTTLNTNGITWNNITFSGASQTFTINSLLSSTGTILLSGVTASTFAGTSGFTTANLTATTVGVTHNFKDGNTYTITTALITTGTAVSKITFTSSHATNLAYLILQQGATQDNSFLNGTRIDSSGGKTICTYKGTLTSTTNWRLLPTQTLIIGN